MLATELKRDPSALVSQAVRANVRASVDKLRQGSDILERHLETGKLLVVGAEYFLESGVVEMFYGIPGAA